MDHLFLPGKIMRSRAESKGALNCGVSKAKPAHGQANSFPRRVTRPGFAPFSPLTMTGTSPAGAAHLVPPFARFATAPLDSSWQPNSVAATETTVPRRGGETGELCVAHMNQGRVISALEIDLRLLLDAVVDNHV
jgi:hypothetical protein